MTDIYVLAEAALICSIPFILMGAGVFLRRRFSGAEGRKAGRWAGNLLLWSGVASLLMFIVFTLNFLGKI
ncbi:MAG: hypothetical protein A2506_01380 [Elusimicrobia bacterium RIFOXYD12_FULL_66_9]|nr:MAG: hypothetical protein A2506_01380 [Elusimicrobia bacterium RIFOXYD12_FULL_66_9]